MSVVLGFFRRLPCTSTHARSFFTVPDFPSLPSWNPEPRAYRERKVFPYHHKALYDVVADVKSYPRFVPYCASSRILRSEPPSGDVTQPLSMDAELTVGFLNFQESYVSKVECTPFTSVKAVASPTPLFNTLSTVWQFDPRPPDSRGVPSTLVTLDLTFSFANPLHATVSSAFFGQVSKMMVKAFEERCQELYGSDSR